VSVTLPTLDQEHELMARGYVSLAGLDEAGRGAWAGPVSAAAVVLPVDDPALLCQLRGVRDSKLCTPGQRDELFDRVCTVALAWAVSLVPALRIDEVGIVAATREAMRSAVAQLCPAPDALLIDALPLPSLPIEQRILIKGDAVCLSIAAASIVAKVTRDRAMIALEEQHGGYGFAQHKGYGTPEHRAALAQLGPTDIHRWYFAPVADVVRQRQIRSDRPVYGKEQEE
jgi:ribonuclease HII